MKKTKSEPLTFEKVWLMFQETDRKFQESKLEWDRQSKETDRILRESNAKTDKRIKELAELFTGQWGKLIEALIAPGCLALFKERGIKVTQRYPSPYSEKNGKTMEIDVLLVNDTELVVIEIKTTASVRHIDELLLDLQEFRYFFPHFKNYKIYGAIAALRYYAEGDKYAQRKGLFVLKSTGENLIQMQNDIKFKPKAF